MVVALRQLLFWTLLCGVLYPLLICGLATAIPQPRLDELVGQNFSDPKYFWGRPSVTAEKPYNAASSSGSNLGPVEPKLEEAHEAAKKVFGKDAPRELVSASGSGLDPHISPRSALYQAGRVARARQMSEADVKALVERHIEPPTFGFMGAPRVNVVRLNRALDSAR